MSGLLKKISGGVFVASVVLAVLLGVITGNIAGLIAVLACGALAALGFYAVGVHFENQETTLELLNRMNDTLEKLAGGEEPVGTKTYGAVPAKKPGPIEAAAKSGEPWVCKSCGQSNGPQYKACSNCRSPR